MKKPTRKEGRRLTREQVAAKWLKRAQGWARYHALGSVNYLYFAKKILRELDACQKKGRHVKANK